MFKKNVVAALPEKPKAGAGLPFGRGPVRRRAVSKGYRKSAALLEFAARFTGAEDTSPVMEETLRALVRDTGGDLGYIMLLDEHDESLVAELAISIGDKHTFPRSRRLGEGIEGHVAASGLPVMFSRRGRKTQADFQFDGEGVVCVPLMRTRPDGSPHQVCGTLTVASYQMGSVFNDRDLELAQSLAALSIVTLANESRYRSLRNSFLKSLQAMARAIESKVPFMEGHGDRVAHVCALLGSRLGLTEDVLDDLRAGAQLHEIGKIGIPDTILLKPGQLTPEEFAALKQYSVIGYDMCKPLGLGEQVLTLIRNHPERLDGTGYPDKLKYGELPLPLRILCVADAFDAMSSYRPYRQVMDTKARQEQLNRFAGTQFDPIVVETLKSLLAEGNLEVLYEEHWAKYAAHTATVVEPPVLVREQQPAPIEPIVAPFAPKPPMAEAHVPAEDAKPDLKPTPLTQPLFPQAKGEFRGEAEAPKIYLTDVVNSPKPIVQPIREEGLQFLGELSHSPGVMLGGDIDDPQSGFAPSAEAFDPALVAEALSSIGIDPAESHAPAVGAETDFESYPSNRKLTLEEAAMEAAAFAADALEAANRDDKAA